MEAAAETMATLTSAETAARLTEALDQAATREAGAQTELVSVEVALLAHGGGSVETALTRKTKSLLFMSAKLVGADAQTLATATSVHRIAG